MLNKIFKYFQSRSTQSIIYAVILIITFISVIIFFVWSLIFLVRLIDSIILTAEEEAMPVSVFNFTDLIALSEKLKIVLPAEAPPAKAPAPVLPIETIATSTDSAKILPEEISLRILNGTRTKGLAKLWQEKFQTNANFKNIETGNAEARNYQGIEIVYKSSKKQALNLIKEILIAHGVGAEKIIEKEGAEETVDFIIIIGKLE